MEKNAELIEILKKQGVEFVEFVPEDREKLTAGAKELWKERVDKLEEQGLPGREAFNALQDIIKRHVSDYEPLYL